MVQLVSKFTARLGQHTYLLRFFVRHDELHTLHTRVSRLLTHATEQITRVRNYAHKSYDTRDLCVLTLIPMPVRLPLHANLLASCVTQ